MKLSYSLSSAIRYASSSITGNSVFGYREKLFSFTFRIPSLGVNPILCGSGKIPTGIPEVKADPPKVSTILIVIYIF